MSLIPDKHLSDMGNSQDLLVKAVPSLALSIIDGDMRLFAHGISRICGMFMLKDEVILMP